MVDPTFTLKPKLARIILPELVKMLALVAVLYSLLSLNLYLAEITLSLFWNIIIYCLLVILVVADIIIKVKRSKTLSVYQDTFSDGEKTILISDSNLSYTRSKLDKIFKTETLIFSPSFEIKHVTDDNQIYTYLQNLIQYARGGSYAGQ